MYGSQLRTILWLRWRLTRNQWSHGGQLNAAISIVVSSLMLVVGVTGGFAGLAVGLSVLSQASPGVILGVWDGTVGLFLLFWIIGILSELQRSEAIDIGKLLHLPISLRGIFVVNYLASHVTTCIIVFVPWMTGLAVGLAVGRGWVMLMLIPLALGFVFMITAWTYLFRGWLVMLMQNPRRYRMIVGGITLVFVLLSQLPNLLMDAKGKHRPRPSARQVQPDAPSERPATNRRGLEDSPTLLWAHRVVPVLWVGNGAMHLAAGGAWPAVLGAAGTFVLAGLGLGRAYRSTRRFYEGRSIKAKTRRQGRKQTAVTGRTLLERVLPGLPDEAAALTLATLRSMTRATEVKLAMASNLMWLVIFGGMLFVRRSGPIGAGAQPFIATAAVVLPFFGMAQLLLNHFGFDRAGFRALVLSPVPRQQILLGKNLALLPLTMGIGLIFLLIAKLALHIPWLLVLAACLQSMTAFLLLSMFGNLISSLLPCRIVPGALRPTKLPAFANIVLILCHASFSAMLAPIFLPPLAGALFARASWLPATPTNLFFSTVELALFVALYSLTLPHLGRLLQGREREILRIVTQEVE